VTRFLAVALAALWCACQSTPLANMQPGEAPALDSDEAGFWMAVDKIEKDLATGGNRIRNPELDAYLKDVICRISPEYCSATRVYVMRQPDFNAAMYPNGAMVVWSGLLVRVQNEAQLAAVLGHEIGHYKRRHTLSMWRRARAATNGLMGIQLLTGGLVPAVADTAFLLTMGTLMQYSRDHESEADALGIEALATAGYDPREVWEIWSGVVREAEVDKTRVRGGFFASHPAPETRLRVLKAEGERLVTAENERETRTMPFNEIVRPLRLMLLGDEIGQRKHDRTEVVVARLQEAELISEAEAAFFRGEAFRVRGEKGDLELASAEYRKALVSHDPLAVTHRNLGLVLRRSGDGAGAREAFERYVESAPAASDRAMVESYIEELKK
jgi:predicted Zn-dependent protease